MIEMIDTHTHLYLQQFEADRNEMIVRTINAGVVEMYLPNIDRSTIDSMHALSDEYPEHIFPMMGLHPCSVDDDYEATLDQMENLFATRSYSGIGETGIDLYWDTTKEKQQIESFRIQIEWAKEKGLPIVIHSRSALDLTISLISENHDERLNGIFHCFDGTLDQARKIMDLGFYMGIVGVITYKKSTISEVVKAIGLERIVLETDAPYLPPVPKRGKRNESSYLLYTAKFISEVLNLPLSLVAQQTTNNAEKIFKKV